MSDGSVWGPIVCTFTRKKIKCEYCRQPQYPFEYSVTTLDCSACVIWVVCPHCEMVNDVIYHKMLPPER